MADCVLETVALTNTIYFSCKGLPPETSILMPLLFGSLTSVACSFLLLRYGCGEPCCTVAYAHCRASARILGCTASVLGHSLLSVTRLAPRLLY